MMKLYGKIRKFLTLKRFIVKPIHFYYTTQYLVFDTWKQVYIEGTISDSVESAENHIPHTGG